MIHNLEYLEKYRFNHGKWTSNSGDQFGGFMIPIHRLKPIGMKMYTMAAPFDYPEDGWEHVSVSLPNRCPTWNEMCWVKELFWSDDKLVVQYHPPKSEYVNTAKYCLHLWRFDGHMPQPTKDCV